MPGAGDPPPLEGEEVVDELQFLKESRKGIRKRVTEISNKLPLEIFDLTEQQSNGFGMELAKFKEKLCPMDQIIQFLLYTKHGDAQVVEDRTQCDAYLYKILKCQKLLDYNNPPSVHINSVPKTQIKLPQLPLPEYSHGKSENLEQFFTKFESIVNKYSVSEYEKYILLEKQISGEPLKLIKSLNSDQLCYSEAKKLLTRAFASPVNQKFEVIARMSKLKMSGHKDVYDFISEMRMLINSVENLKIDALTILQFFVWSGMPEDLQCQLVNMCNLNKPSLTLIQKHIFEAAERYVAVSKSREKLKANDGYVSGLAANISGNFKPPGEYKNREHFKSCVLCSIEGKADHPIHKCSAFKDAKSKTDKLKSMKACLRCAGLSHFAKDCLFKFRKPCYFCKSPNHFSFLCLSDSRNRASDTNARSGGRSSNADVHQLSVTCNALNSGLSSNTILPTFTVRSVGNNLIRGLKDSGCTACFVKKSLAEREKFKILKKVNINVNGVNSTQNYKTNIVQLVLNIGNKVVEIPAIVLPEIKTKFYIRGLGAIVGEFINRGCQLADSYLSAGDDEINNIELILGSNYGHLLPESQVVFGKSGDCVYSNTSIGVLLMGDIDKIKENLNFIPSVVDSYVSVTEGDSLEQRLNRLESMLTKMTAPEESSKVKVGVKLQVDTYDAFLCLTDNCSVSELTEDQILLETDDSNLDNACSKVLNLEKTDPEDDEKFDQLNRKLIDLTLSNISRNKNGRLVVPLLWNSNTAHMLGKNYNLASKILGSVRSKLEKKPLHFYMMDDIIKEQVDLGVIERVHDLEQLKSSNTCSFMAHMPIFRVKNDKTKCRIVYLSNLSEKSSGISHNIAMNSGPCLNRKLSASFLQLRFDQKLLVFDLVKAFLQVAVPEVDQNKLCFLWFKNVNAGNFNLTAYKFLRLPFGLKCSPFILMISLYYILMVNTSEESEKITKLKELIWNLIYMDNGAVTCGSSDALVWAFEQLEGIFGPFGFQLQEFVTNDEKLSKIVSLKTGEETVRVNRLFGLRWDTTDDTIFTYDLCLDNTACTKRAILKSIASNFDIFGFNLPLMNRSRLFMQSLQNDRALAWDTEISGDLCKQWKNICNQVNNVPPMKINRFIGSRDEEYSICAFTDSSKNILGVVIYILRESAQEMKFVLAKNRLISRKLESRSIPSLELQGITFGAETLMEVYDELCGPTCVIPLKIKQLRLFSDSLVSLSWIKSHSIKFDKLSRLSVYVNNRLGRIAKICERNPVTFEFCAGLQNPADAVSRPFSHAQLSKTNYYTGLSSAMLEEMRLIDNFAITVPWPHLVAGADLHLAEVLEESEELYDVRRSSSYTKVLNINLLLYKFINILKSKIKENNSSKFSNIVVHSDNELRKMSVCHTLKQDQLLHFSECINYYSSNCTRKSKIPQLITQLNIFKDNDSLLRVRGKLKVWREESPDFPILLSKQSYLAELLVNHIHHKLAHAGYYVVLNELRKSYWIPSAFSLVKKCIRHCVICKRLNGRVIKLNQGSYRDFRLEPSSIPFKCSFIDYIGPISVRENKTNVKRYLLLFSCLWSRAINIEICNDLSLRNFLRAFQLHIFSHGAPSLVWSDLGSQIVAGAAVIEDFLKDSETQLFFRENNVKSIQFNQYFKGCNKLGGLVESCVKLIKKLIFGSIKNLVLNETDFVFLIRQINHLVNRRPIALSEGLRDTDNARQDLVCPITPEILLHGRELISLNVVPQLQQTPSDYDWSFNSDHIDTIHEHYAKLLKARKQLDTLYNEEFLPKLMAQSIREKDKYSPVEHHRIAINDIILLKEPMLKPSSYPLAVVLKIVKNDLDEVTAVEAKKGSTQEVVKRHVDSVVPLLRSNVSVTNLKTSKVHTINDKPVEKRMQRVTAKRCRDNINKLSIQGKI